MRTGRNRRLLEPANLKEFNLVDLSLLINILKNIKTDELNNSTMENIILNMGERVLQAINSPELINNQNISFSVRKINKAIRHIESVVIEQYMHNLRSELADPGQKMGYIYSRLVDYGLFMETRNYIGFLRQYGIEIDRNLINQGRFPCQSSLNSKSGEELDNIFQNIQEPTQFENNLLIFYNLLALTRILIGINQLSIIEYFYAYDEFEVTANHLLNFTLRHIHIYTYISNYRVSYTQGHYQERALLLDYLRMIEGHLRQSYNPSFIH
uniref:Uncharacterized protein n=1 Tax=Meloidogyne javanica TaxID=6303 RepID=A0A915LGW3_MELJA